MFQKNSCIFDTLRRGVLHACISSLYWIELQGIDLCLAAFFVKFNKMCSLPSGKSGNMCKVYQYETTALSETHLYVHPFDRITQSKY